MSLLSREDLRVALGPERVDLVRLKRRWREHTISARQNIACEPVPGDPPWRAAIDALAPALARAGGAAVNASVVLSDHFVRYLLLPWRSDLRGESEIEALARIRFKEVYGAAADGWEIRLTPSRFGAYYLACAIDRDLLRGLAEAASKEKLRLVSVRPVFVSAYNRWRKAHAAEDCWFAACETGRLSLCRVESGTWRSVRSQRFGGDLARELQLAVERESLTLCIDPAGAALHVFAPEQPRLAAGSVTGLMVSVFEPLPGVEPRYAMALA